MNCLLVGGLLAVAQVGPAPEPLERVGRLAEPAIREASGMVTSRQYPGIYWVHNDSGNAPELFAVRRDGRLVRSFRVAAPNLDWEDIATDDAGHLYLADTGTNKNPLPVRVIHRIAEPDPTAAPGPADPLPVQVSTYYKFKRREKFDSEGLIVAGRQALLVTKRHDGQPAEIYRVPLDPPAPLIQPATPERVGRLAGCDDPVTGASLARDGQTLAVVTIRSIHVYRSADLVDWMPVSSTPFKAPDVEAITWDGPDLILASEDRSIYRVPAARLRAVPPGSQR